MTNKSDKTQGGPMIKFLAKLFPCKHPLDKVRLIRCTSSPSADGNHTLVYEQYICHHCLEEVTKSYECMTEEYAEFLRAHKASMAKSLFFGSTAGDPKEFTGLTPRAKEDH